MICKGLRPKERNPPVPKLTSQQRGKVLSIPTGRLELLAPKTIHGERAMLPFPLQKVKPGCGPIPLAAAGQVDLAIAVLQHAQSLGGFELIKKGSRLMNRGYNIKCACEGKHCKESRPDRKADNGEGARQSATKKLGCPVSFDLLELRATDIEKDKEEYARLQHLEPAWYLVGLPEADHNEDCTRRTSAKARAINTRADSAIAIPRSLVSREIIDEMLDAVVPLFLFSKMQRRTLFDSIAATPGPHGPWGAVLKALAWGPDHLWHNASRKAGTVRLVHPEDDLKKFLAAGEFLRNNGGFFEKRVNSTTRRLEGVVWGNEWQLKQLGDVYHDLMIFDTTHHTNKYSLYLGVFSVEGKNGKTLPLAAALLARQSAEDFEWVFDVIAKLRGEENGIEVMMTDQAPAIAKGLVQSKLKCNFHQLCVWHMIGKNLPANLKRYSTENSFKRMEDKIWSFALSDEDMDEEQLAVKWGEIVAFTNNNLKPPDPKESSAFQHYPAPHGAWPQHIPEAKHVYLNKLWDCRDKWVRACVKALGCFTGHVKTTQRAEAVNNVLAPIMGKNTTLVEQFQAWDQYVHSVEDKEVRTEQQRYEKKTKMVVTSLKPLERFINTEYGITAYIKDKLVDQLALADTYKVSESGEAERGEGRRFFQVLPLVEGGAGGDGEKVVVDDDGRGIADMVGLNESAAEWMSGLDHEEETDAVSGSIEGTVGLGGAVPAFRGAGPSGPSRRGRVVEVVCEQTEKGVIMMEARCSCGYLHTKGYPCRHVLRVALHLHVTVLSEGLVLARWHVQDSQATARVAAGAATTIRPTAGRRDGGEERAGRDYAMVVEGVDATMRDMFLELRAMVEEMGGARGVLEPRALAAVQQLHGLMEVIIRTKGAVLPDLSHYAVHLDGSYALKQAVGLHGGGGLLGSADVEELETLPPTQEGGGGGRSRMSTVSGRKAKQQKTNKSKHGRGRPVGSGGGGGAGDVPSSMGGGSSPLLPPRKKARPAVVEKGNGGGADEGAAAAELKGPSTDLILKSAKQSARQGVPPVAFAQSSMAAAPSGKENGGTRDGESGGGKEGPHIAAIPALRIASRPGQPRLPHMPAKLILRLPTSGQGQASAGGLMGHQQQEGQETGDGESGGGKEGPHIAATPALRIASRPGQPRLPHMPVKLILRLPTSGQGQASAGGLMGHQQQEGQEQHGQQ
jgi:hypothetical protein